MTPQIGGNDDGPQFDCTDGCGASYRNEALARLCCDRLAQAALQGRRSLLEGQHGGGGRSYRGP